MTLLNSPFDFTARHDAESKRDLVPEAGKTYLPGEPVMLDAAASVPYGIKKFAGKDMAAAATQPDAPIWVVIQGNSELEYNPTGKIVGIAKDMKFTTELINPTPTTPYAVGAYVTALDKDSAGFSWDMAADYHSGEAQRVGVITRIWNKEGVAVLDIELVA
jgi:hypothetical protein